MAGTEGRPGNEQAERERVLAAPDDESVCKKVRAEVRDLAGGIEDAHVVFATSWETAYPVLATPALADGSVFLRTDRHLYRIGRRGAE